MRSLRAVEVAGHFSRGHYKQIAASLNMKDGRAMLRMD